MLPYTGRVQRFVAIVVAFAFIGAAAQASRVHIHAYTGHDHPEHDHAPAAHEHPQPVAHHDQDDGAAHLEPCDPGQHAVSITVACPPLSRLDVLEAPSAITSSLERLVLMGSAHTVTDVRVHGPPCYSPASPRAPPLTLPA